MNNNSKLIYFIRVLAGGYLVYLSGPMLKDVMAGKTGNDVVIILVGSIIFIIVGILLILHSIWSLYKHRNDGIEDGSNIVEEIEEHDNLEEAQKQGIEEMLDTTPVEVEEQEKE